MYDVIDWTLVWLPAIFGTHAAGVSPEFLGCYQRTAGKIFNIFIDFFLILYQII